MADQPKLFGNYNNFSTGSAIFYLDYLDFRYVSSYFPYGKYYQCSVARSSVNLLLTALPHCHNFYLFSKSI